MRSVIIIGGLIDCRRLHIIQTLSLLFPIRFHSPRRPNLSTTYQLSLREGMPVTDIRIKGPATDFLRQLIAQIYGAHRGLFRCPTAAKVANQIRALRRITGGNLSHGSRRGNRTNTGDHHTNPFFQIRKHLKMVFFVFFFQLKYPDDFLRFRKKRTIDCKQLNLFSFCFLLMIDFMLRLILRLAGQLNAQTLEDFLIH